MMVPAHKAKRTIDPNKTLPCTNCDNSYPATIEYFPPQKRYTATYLHSWCRNCHRAAQRAAHKADPSSARESARAYHKKHPDYRRQYNEKNREKMLEYGRQWR